MTNHGRHLLTAVLLLGLGWAGPAYAVTVQGADRPQHARETSSCCCGAGCDRATCCCARRRAGSPADPTPVPAPLEPAPSGPCLGGVPCGLPGIPGTPAPARIPERLAVVAWPVPFPAVDRAPLLLPSLLCLLPPRRIHRLEKPPESEPSG